VEEWSFDDPTAVPSAGSLRPSIENNFRGGRSRSIEEYARLQESARNITFSPSNARRSRTFLRRIGGEWRVFGFSSGSAIE
jgi:hypothetical protein